MVVVPAVPEPATYAAIIGLLAPGFVCWRRRSISLLSWVEKRPITTST
ncbi:MAG: PEP-CTERM sorting domain-containing protein [Opitutaceae bacterium]|nr:PEP-CTERM sorting domain-containing protein [Opitutaceae bacterium]